MKDLKVIFWVICFAILPLPVFADDIDIANFRELLDSNVTSGDTLVFTDNLNSDATIGAHFSGLDISFDGNNYYINGNKPIRSH